MRISVRSLQPLADRLMRGGGRDEMGEALEGDRVAILQIVRNGLGQGQEFRHGAVIPRKFVLRTYVLYAIHMPGFAADVNRGTTPA